jgi:hypothetical protein
MLFAKHQGLATESASRLLLGKHAFQPASLNPTKNGHEFPRGRSTFLRSRKNLSWTTLNPPTSR